jgi:ribonuclease P protein component
VASFAFGRERRIRRRPDFVRVQSNGQRATSRHFVLLVCAREPGAGTAEPSRALSRIGIVATRKVGDATMRNRIKRLCRECFRLWPDFIPNGVDLVVIAREGASELTLDRVRDEWSRARPALLKRCESVLRGKPDEAPAASTPPRRPRKS